VHDPIVRRLHDQLRDLAREAWREVCGAAELAQIGKQAFLAVAAQALLQWAGGQG
jgi:hypothetical protein